MSRFHRVILHRLQHCHFRRTADESVVARYADDAAFQRLLAAVDECEAVDVATVCQAIFDMATADEAMERGYIEFGVFKGDTLNFAREALPASAAVVGVDTFSGNTHAWTNPHDVGAYSAGGLPRVPPNVCLIKADVCQMGPFFDLMGGNPFRVVHLDLDSYEPTYAALSGLLRRRMVDETTVLVADEAAGIESFVYTELRAIYDAASEHRLTVTPLYRGPGSEYCNSLQNNFISFHQLKSGAAFEANSPTPRSLAFRLVAAGR